MELNAELPMAPSGWRVREALSTTCRICGRRSTRRPSGGSSRRTPAERAAFLRRSGVRRCVLPAHRTAAVARRRGGAGLEHARVRVRSGRDARVRRLVRRDRARPGGPRPGSGRRSSTRRSPTTSRAWARCRRRRAGRARRSPRRAHRRGRRHDGGRGGVGAARRHPGPARFVRSVVDRRAWTALPAGIARVNGLYRAVALPPGRHVIRFSYRPRDLADGSNHFRNDGSAPHVDARDVPAGAAEPRPGAARRASR